MNCAAFNYALRFNILRTKLNAIFFIRSDWTDRCLPLPRRRRTVSGHLRATRGRAAAAADDDDGCGDGRGDGRGGGRGDVPAIELSAEGSELARRLSRRDRRPDDAVQEGLLVVRKY